MHLHTFTYRPISLLPTVSKIAEKVILNRLRKFFSENKKIPYTQFGFKNYNSTTEQALRMVEKIYNEDFSSSGRP